MIKQIAIVLIQVFLATLIIYPFSSVIADIMITTMTPGLITTIILTMVRYIGFFIGVGFVMWLYNGAQTRTPVYTRGYGQWKQKTIF